MTDFEFERLLTEAAEQYAMVQAAELLRDAPEVTPSEAYLSWERDFLSNPMGYAKRNLRPLWRRALARAGQVAACFLLAGSLTYAAVPPARAWVHQAVQFVVEWLDTNTRFRFQGEAQGDLGHWRPEYLPEGYEEVDALDLGNGWSITFENETEDQMLFRYTLVEDGDMLNFDNEHSTYSEIQMNDQPAHLFTAHSEGWPSYLVWLDEEGEIGYFLMADLPVEEFLKTAQSVAAQ